MYEHRFTDEQIEQTLGGMVRVVYKIQSEGEDFELDPRLRSYFENEVGLTNDQIELVQGLAQRIAHGQRDQSSNAREDKRGKEYEAVARRIRAAVEAGEMTKEQGRARLAGYRRRIGRGAREENQRAESGESKPAE